MTWKTLFPDTSVWMSQSMVRAHYEVLRDLDVHMGALVELHIN